MSGDTITLDRPALDPSLTRMQWCGSDDAIIWTEWETLTSIEMLVPYHEYYQARVLIDGQWLVSPIETDW